MSEIGNKIVFIINPYEGSSTLRQQWSRTIQYSVLNFLHYFNKLSKFGTTSCENGETDELRWAYRFVNTGGQKLYRTKQELKEFNREEFSFFEQEVKYIAGEEVQRSSESTYFTGSAHALSEELMAVVHDYTWDQSDIISPVKLHARRKGRTKSNTKRLFRENCKKIRQDAKDNRSEFCNYVVILSPVPQDQSELDQYFEWHVDSSEHIANKLMPQHLRSHFIDKNNIRLIWMDVRLSHVEIPGHDDAGTQMIEQFLQSIQGGLFPSLSAFDVPSEQDLTSIRLIDDVFDDLSSISSTNKLHDSFTMSSIFSCFFDQITSKNTPDGGPSHILHVCHKMAAHNGTFQIEKLWSMKILQTGPVSSNVEALLSQSCPFCTKNSISEINGCDAETASVSFSPNPSKNTESDLPKQVNVRFRNCAKSCKTPNLPKPESVVMLMGVLPQHGLSEIFRSDSLNNVTSMWCTIQDECGTSTEGGSFTSKLSPNKFYIAKIHKYCTVCGNEPSTCLSYTSSYVIIRIIARKLVLVFWMGSSAGRTIVALLNSEVGGWLDQGTVPSSAHETVALQKSGGTSEPHKPISVVKPTSYSGCMLESWYQFVSMNDTSLNFQTNGISRPKRIAEVDEEILGELQSHYRSLQQNASKLLDPETNGLEQKDEMTSTVKENPENEFESTQSMISALRMEYEKALEVKVDTSCVDVPLHYCGAIVQTAQTITSVVFHHVQNMQEHKEQDWRKEAESLLQESFLHSAADIRKRHAKKDEGKLQESILQILLTLELASQIQMDEEAIESTAEEISSFLRLISLSSNLTTMKICLSDVFVANYGSSCGELLCEVHNELMQPLPMELKPFFSKEASDESYLMSSSVKSSVMSIQSSLPSLCSSGGPESNKRKSSVRSFKSFAPKIGFQIEVPGALKNTKPARNGSETGSESIKHRLRSSTKKDKPTHTHETKEIGRVKRDLFAAMGSDKKSSAISSEKPTIPQTQSQRRMSVSDTPDAKQRMTALCRQRARQHREKRKECGSGELLEVIEESPAKFVEETKLEKVELRRSPRHKIMLARRHSFYREGKESRTVARAKVIQQHHEVTPATPVIKKDKRKKEKEQPLFSPNSLLFVRNTQKAFSPLRDPNPLTHVDDSPAKNTRSHATKALFQSPSKGAESCRGPTPHKLLSPGVNDRDTDLFIVGIEPIVQSPIKTPQKQTSLLRKVLETPSKGKVSPRTPNKNPMPSPVKTPKKATHPILSPRKTPTRATNNTVVYSSLAERTRSATRSSRKNLPNSPEEICNKQTILDLVGTSQEMLELERLDDSVMSQAHSKTDDSVMSGPMDDYIIRTPRSALHCNGSVTKVRHTKKRKWSQDTTPTRDDINQWPRKKRGVDKSSPGVVTRKSRKNSTSPSEKEDLIGDSCTNENNYDSPDHGLFIFDSGTGSSIARSCSAVKLPPLREIRATGTDSNENIIHQVPFIFDKNTMKLPPTPQLRLSSARKASSSTWKSTRFATQVPQDDWDDVFPLETSEHVQDPRRTLKDPGLSARSLLHIQNSPILTPRSKRKQSTQSVK